MNKLLSANFSRMWKSKSFWLGILITCSVMLYDLAKAVHYVRNTPGTVMDPSAFLFVRRNLVLLAAAVFTGFFIGKENSDKTMHNKIIVGHSRTTIYLANLVVCACAGLMFHLAPTLLAVGLGISLLGPMTGSADILLTTLLISMVTVIAAVSLFTVLSMLISSKTIGIVTVLLLCLGMLYGAEFLGEALAEPETVYGYAVTDVHGSKTAYASQSNPRYLDGAKRAVYQLAFDCLPSGQMCQYNLCTLPENVKWFPFYSSALAIVTSFLGIWAFRKKNMT